MGESGNLGNRFALGVVSTANKIAPGNWLVTYTPQMMPTLPAFEIWHGAIIGPGGYFRVYQDDSLFGIGENGAVNEYSPSGSPMLVLKGQTVTLHWSIATGSAPQCWLYFRQPEVGRI